MPMSYLPFFLASWMTAPSVSAKYWNKAFCWWTSIPKIRFRNFPMLL